MLKDITIGQYYPTSSIIHDFDPRLKLCGAVVLMIALFVVDSAPSFALFAIFLSLIIHMANIPLKLLLRGIKALLWFFMFTIALNLFLVKGKTLFQLPTLGLAISHEGLKLAYIVTCRLILTVTITSILTLTTSPFRLMDGLESLLSPLKKVRLPIGEVALMMMMAMRFIPLLIDESERISKAQKARCADLESKNPITRVKNLVPMLIPLFSSSLRRAEEIAVAMEARCFIPGAPRTHLYELKFKRVDLAALVSVLGFIALLISVAKV